MAQRHVSCLLLGLLAAASAALLPIASSFAQVAIAALVFPNLRKIRAPIKIKSALPPRRPHSSYQRVVQGKCPLHFLSLNGVVCSNTLFSNTSALTSSLLFRGNSTCKILEHLVWSNTSGFQFLGPLARTNFLSALCGLPIPRPKPKIPPPPS